MDTVIIIILSLAIVIALITLGAQLRSNRIAHRDGTGVGLSQSWIIIAVNIFLLIVCVFLLFNVVDVLHIL